jgi:hypothetical protein
MVYRKVKQYCGFKTIDPVTGIAVSPEKIQYLEDGGIYEGEVVVDTDVFGDKTNFKITLEDGTYIRPRIEYFEEPITLEIMRYLKLRKKSEHGSMKV